MLDVFNPENESTGRQECDEPDLVPKCLSSKELYTFDSVKMLWGLLNPEYRGKRPSMAIITGTAQYKNCIQHGTETGCLRVAVHKD